MTLFTYTNSQGSLPPGLTLSPGGVLAGTPTRGGDFNFTVTATDIGGCGVSSDYTLSVTGPLPPILSAGPVIVDGNFVVHFAGTPNVTYAIESATDLDQGSWEHLTNITASPSGDIELNTPVGSEPIRFFRVTAP